MKLLILALAIALAPSADVDPLSAPRPQHLALGIHAETTRLVPCHKVDAAEAALSTALVLVSAARAREPRWTWPKLARAPPPEVKWKADGTHPNGGGLTRADYALLARAFAASDSVFEWGAGTSTSLGGAIGVPRYVSVDSDQDYLDLVARKLPAAARQRTTLYKADIGATLAWGNPKDTSEKMHPNFRKYSRAVWVAAPKVKSYDFYLVDGRFRLACVAQALLHAAADGRGPEDFIVGLHDFEGGSHHYGRVLLIAERIGGAGGETCGRGTGLKLVLLRRRADVSDAQIEQYYQEWMHHVQRM